MSLDEFSSAIAELLAKFPVPPAGLPSLTQENPKKGAKISAETVVQLDPLELIDMEDEESNSIAKTFVR